MSGDITTYRNACFANIDRIRDRLFSASVLLHDKEVNITEFLELTKQADNILSELCRDAQAINRIQRNSEEMIRRKQVAYRMTQERLAAEEAAAVAASRTFTAPRPVRIKEGFSFD